MAMGAKDIKNKRKGNRNKENQFKMQKRIKVNVLQYYMTCSCKRTYMNTVTLS